MSATNENEKIVRVQLVNPLIGVFPGETTGKSITPGQRNYRVRETPQYLEISRRDQRRKDVEVVACIYSSGIIVVKERPWIEEAETATEPFPRPVSTDDGSSSAEPALRRARTTSRAAGSEQ